MMRRKVSAIGSESSKPLIMHWNGKKWTPVSIAGGAWLSGLAGVSANNVWAVGNIDGHGSGRGAAIVHWNGKAWSLSS
jgi:hypothetical protein